MARSFDALGALGVVCEASPAAVDAIKKQYPQVRTTSSYADVLADASITKVAIAAPAALHYELAEAALKAGISKGAAEATSRPSCAILPAAAKSEIVALSFALTVDSSCPLPPSNSE